MRPTRMFSQCIRKHSFLGAEVAFTMVFSAQHFNLGKEPFYPAPFHGQLQNRPQDFQLPV